jgi:hypothetical protein
MLCKCSLCGEELTAPQVYNGLMYGYTCVKRINPNYKKPKNPQFFVLADSFEVEELNQYQTKVTAFIKGVKFLGWITKRTNIIGNILTTNEGIVISENNAYIDLLAYPKSNKAINLYHELKTN